MIRKPEDLPVIDVLVVVLSVTSASIGGGRPASDHGA
jgi:hypothetical protein